MKSCFSLLFIAFLFFANTTQAQQNYEVDGQTYSLKTELEGSLTLLWNVIDEEFRYFSKKGDEIVELKNTKANGDYQEEYKAVLKEQMADANVSVDKTSLTLPSLRNAFVAYNTQKDAGFQDDRESIALNLRLGAFAGISNSIFTDNINNDLQPVAGVDLEILDEVKLKRHAIVIRFKHAFETSELKSSNSQFSLNYRFKFIKSEKFDMYLSNKFIAYTFSKREALILKPGNDVFTVEEITNNDFTAPFVFGFGADYKVGNGYITFNYNDIIGVNIDSNEEFPTEFTLGYKINL